MNQSVVVRNQTYNYTISSAREIMKFVVQPPLPSHDTTLQDEIITAIVSQRLPMLTITSCAGSLQVSNLNFDLSFLFEDTHGTQMWRDF